MNSPIHIIGAIPSIRATLGQVISRVRAVAAVIDHDALGRLLAAAVKRDGRPVSEIDTYEMVVR